MMYLLIETVSGNDRVISSSDNTEDLYEIYYECLERARAESWFIIPEDEYDHPEGYRLN